MKRNGCILIMTTAVVTVVIAAWLLLTGGFMRVDDCLDAGGRWNQARGRCEGERL